MHVITTVCVYDVQSCTGGHPVCARLTDCRGHGSAAYLIASRTTVLTDKNYIIFKKNIASAVRTGRDELVTTKSALLAAEGVIFQAPGAISVSSAPSGGHLGPEKCAGKAGEVQQDLRGPQSGPGIRVDEVVCS